MASSLIGSLRVALGLDTAQFEAGANKSRSIARGLSKDIESSFKSAKVAVEGLVAAFAIGALTEQIKQSLQYAAAIGETASTLGVTTKQLQEFRFAASQVGVSQETLDGGLKRLAITLGQLKVGAEAPAKALEALQKGLSAQVKAAPNTGEAFLKIADALSKVTDRTQRAAVEVAIFKKGGADLDSVLVGGSARINALAQAAHQLGIVLSEEQIRNAEVTAHKLEALKTVLEANIASIVTQNSNSILSLAQAISTLTNSILRFFSSNPQLALGIIGGLAGSRFGVAGAALGAAGGALLGENVARSAADQNTDIRFRLNALKAARDEVNARRAASADTGGLISFRHGSGKGGTVDTAIQEFKRQKSLFDQAIAASGTPKPGPGINLPPFLAPKGPKGRKGPADRSEELLAQMDKEILQASQNILQAKLSLAGSSEQHLQIAIQLVEIEKTVRLAAIDEEIAKAKRERAEGKITAAALQEAEHKGAILKAEAEMEAQVKLQLIVERELTQHEHDLVALADQQLKFRMDALHTADQLATTQADHRRIQLAILDAEIEQQRLQLESNKRDAIRNGAKQEEIDLIQKSIDNLSTQRAQGAAVINDNTLDPLEAWKKAVPKTAAEINEALKSIEVKGLDGLSEAITGIITGTESMKEAFHNLAASILSDLIQMTIKMLLFKALQAAFGGGGGLGQSAFPISGGVDPLAPRAGGGSVSGGTAYLVGERGPEVFMPATSGSIIPNNRLGFGNDNSPGMGGKVELTMHNDFRGADPSAVAAITAKLSQMEAEFPGKVVEAWADADSRFLFRAKRR